MRTSAELLRHRPGGEAGMTETRDEREKAMQWNRKETTVKTFLVFVTMAATLSIGVLNALTLCGLICLFMVCARLHEWIPSEKVARINRARPTCTVNYDGGEKDIVIWVGYNPPNLLQRPLGRFGTTSSALQFLFYFLSVVFFEKFGFFSVCGLLILDLIVGYYINIAVDKFERISRANILLTKEGIGFDYSIVGSSAATPLIPWSKIETVTFARTGRTWFETASLQFRILMHKYPDECESVTANFPGNFFVENSDSDPILVLSVRADGLASAVHRRDLIAFITANLPAEKIHGRQEPVDTISSSRSQAPTYTDIWMGSLSISKAARLRRSDLVKNTSLCDGRYTVIEQLGAGGQGVAYTAWDELSREIIVLKEYVLPSTNAIDVQERAATAVSSEAELLSKLHHPNIVTLLDNFVEDQRAYLVVEFIDGSNLRKYVHENGPFDEFKMLELGEQMCEILSYLHTLPVPVIHRDFTPDNLIYMPTGKVKLLDFNVAMQGDSADTRAVVGKHAYLPPEQFRGKATIQSDLYALGATMFFLLTGMDPEPISTSHPASAAAPVSAELDAIVAKATDPSLSDRYQTASILNADIQRLKLREPIISN